MGGTRGQLYCYYTCISGRNPSGDYLCSMAHVFDISHYSRVSVEQITRAADMLY